MFWLSLYLKKGLTITKQEFRFHAKARLNYCATHRQLADKAINKAIFAYLSMRKYKNVLVYMPFGDEANINPLISLLRKKKCRVFIPFIQEISFKMIPLRLPLHKNSFGIYESNNSIFKINKVDVAIVPVLGIDKHFKRIGFGKGMYDRFMSACKNKIHIIFIARSPNYSPNVITQHHDISGDCFFTPSALCVRKRNGTMVCNRKYNLWIIGGRKRISH